MPSKSESEMEMLHLQLSQIFAVVLCVQPVLPGTLVHVPITSPSSQKNNPVSGNPHLEFAVKMYSILQK